MAKERLLSMNGPSSAVGFVLSLTHLDSTSDDSSFLALRIRYEWRYDADERFKASMASRK